MHDCTPLRFALIGAKIILLHCPVDSWCLGHLVDCNASPAALCLALLVLHCRLPRNLSICLELQATPMACALNSSDNKNSLLILTEKVKKIRTPPSWAAHAWSIGREDPRRLVHALKVGTALTLVSLLYILDPLFKGVGKNAMWAVMTVVVVLEFTAGATLCKGLNRGLGTVMAGSLAFIIELVAIRSGKVFRALFVGSSVFLIGTNLQSDNSLKLPTRGCAAFSARSPNHDCYRLCHMSLHEPLCITKLAHYASWEPRHSMHCYSYPWQKYVKLGSVLRHFAYTVAAIHGCLESEIQTPPSVRSLFQNPCARVAREVTKVLQELAISIRDHHRCAPDVLSDHLHEALQDLNSAIRSQPRLFLGSKHACANSRAFMELNSGKQMASRTSLPSFKTDTTSILERKNAKVDQPSERSERSTLRPTLSKIAMKSLEFSEALPFAAFASLLVEMVVRLELVIEEVKELERVANFREFPEHDHLTIDLTYKEKIRNTNGAPLESHTVSTEAE